MNLGSIGAILEAGKEVAECAPAIGVQPAPTPVLGCVVDHVAALAQRGEIVRLAVGRIVIEVSAGEHHAGGPGDSDDIVARLADVPPPPVPPAMPFAIPPAAIAQVDDGSAMRTAAMFASSFRPPEADEPRQLRPVDWVQPAMFSGDWHTPILIHFGQERKGKCYG